LQIAIVVNKHEQTPWKIWATWKIFKKIRNNEQL
jgi:hypothetical protein